MKQPTDEELSDFIAFIKSRFGIVIQKHQIDLLMAYLSTACEHHGFASYREYLSNLYLSSEDGSDPFMQHMCANITVDESYFFRDSRQMAFLEEYFLPELIRKRVMSDRRRLKIWSAGCANGQELYTIMIMLDRLIGVLDGWEIAAIGSDINDRVLAQAREGQYRHLAFRTTPDDVRAKYFKTINSTLYEIDRKFIQYMRFLRVNLSQPSKDWVSVCDGRFDLIMCRNVFIYLDQEVVSRAVRSFIELLNDDGILLLGPSDILHDKIEGAELCRDMDVIYYRKQIEKDVAANMCPIINEKTVPHDVVKRMDSDVEVLEPAVEEDLKLCDVVEEITSADSVDASQSLEALKERALKLANAAEYERGLTVIDQCLTKNELDAESYFIKGLICMGLKQYQEAEAQFKSAMFLKNDMPEVAYQLGLCLRVEGYQEEGMKMLRTALKIAERCDPEKKIMDVDGTTVGEFKIILSNEVHGDTQMKG